MQAQSLVVGARALDRQASSALSERQLEPERIRRRGMEQLSILSTLSALIATGTPLPVPDTRTDPDNILVKRLLTLLYDDGKLTFDGLAQSDRPRAAQSERVRVTEQVVIIPLGADSPTGRNWRPVFRLLIDRLDDIAKKCERIVSRIETHSFTPVVSRTWQSVVETLREVRDLLKTQLARQERLNRLYTRRADEPMQFAAWTIERLTDETTES